MWWLAIPVIGLVGKAIYDAVTDEDEAPSPRRKTTLELNLERLEEQLQSHSGYKIAILGQSGAGKSSLLKKMTNGKVKPLPVIGAQTADVPGYDTSSHPLYVFSSSFPFRHFDAFIFVIHGKLHSSDEDVFRLISRSGKRISIAKSFSDSLESDDIVSVENDIRTRLSLSDSASILFFSNRTGVGGDLPPISVPI